VPYLDSFLLEFDYGIYINVPTAQVVHIKQITDVKLQLQNSKGLNCGQFSAKHAQRNTQNKKLSYCWETVRREIMPMIAEINVEMTT